MGRAGALIGGSCAAKPPLSGTAADVRDPCKILTYLDKLTTMVPTRLTGIRTGRICIQVMSYKFFTLLLAVEKRNLAAINRIPLKLVILKADSF